MLIGKPDLLRERQWSTSYRSTGNIAERSGPCSTERIPKTWPKTSGWLGIILKDLRSLPETPRATPKIFNLSCFKRRRRKGFCLKVLLRIQANISPYGSKKISGYLKVNKVTVIVIRLQAILDLGTTQRLPSGWVSLTLGSTFQQHHHSKVARWGKWDALPAHLHFLLTNAFAALSLTILLPPESSFPGPSVNYGYVALHDFHCQIGFARVPTIVDWRICPAFWSLQHADCHFVTT